VWLFRSPKVVNPGLLATPFDYPKTRQIQLAEDTLTEYLNPSSDAYFATVPSADIQTVTAMSFEG